MTARPQPSPAVDFEAIRTFLRSPRAHDGLPAREIETHMSFVFLSERLVLKLKKPVRYEFLDFSTLALREHYCREESRLNARLAPDVYLGVRALQWHDGHLTLLAPGQQPSAGETVDWVVAMRRLPESRMLDRQIADRRVDVGAVDALVPLLAAFYRSAPVADVSPDAYLERFVREQATHRAVLCDAIVGLPEAVRPLERMDAVLAAGAGLLRARASDGHVVDGHGDLRPEHVCLTRPPVIIDCLEFNVALRQVDPIDEIEFLALECDVAGAPWIGARLRPALTLGLGDAPPPALLAMYRAHRALLRARLALAHLLDPQPRTPQRWRPLARRYLEFATAALDGFSAPAAR